MNICRKQILIYRSNILRVRLDGDHLRGLEQGCYSVVHVKGIKIRGQTSFRYIKQQSSDYSLDEISHAISIFLDCTVMLLPSIEPSMVPPGVQPLLVFVNVKSGGCQGLQLISSFRKLLNPYQVFDLDNGGPLPGCVKNYNIRIFSSCSIRVIYVYNVTLQSLRFPSHKGL